MASVNDRSSRDNRALRLLIVEDDTFIRGACQTIARQVGFQVYAADSVPAALAILAEIEVDVALLDLQLGSGSGLTVLEQIQWQQSRVAVIVMTAFATVDSAINSLRAGVLDYIQKPFSMEELAEVLESAHHQVLGNSAAGEAYDDSSVDKSLELLCDRSPAIEKIRRIVPRVAAATHPVLIIGEPGSGKETVARSIHFNSSAASGPFVSLNCSTLACPDMDHRLFGETAEHDTSASGALISELGGTVFLNEIGDLAPTLQLKLTRVLEEKTVRLSGSLKTIPITARIVGASSCALENLVSAGRFRKDLYLRLNVVNLHVPPLRQRKKAIPRLAATILNRLSVEGNRPPKLGRSTIRHLMRYDWPGNIRELQDALEYASIVSSGSELNVSDLPRHIQECHFDASRPSVEAPCPVADDSESAVLPLAEIEKNVILKTIRQLNGDKALAAAMLGIGKTTLYRKLKEYQTANISNS